MVVCAAAAATSCLHGGKNEYSWTKSIIGTLTTENLDTQETVYTNDAAQAQVEVPDGFTNSVDFHLDNVKFVEQMPSVSIVIPGLRFTLAKEDDAASYPKGSWIIDATDIVPTVGGVPYDTYKMHTVKGVISDTSVTLSFTLTFDGANYRATFIDRGQTVSPQEPQK